MSEPKGIYPPEIELPDADYDFEKWMSPRTERGAVKKDEIVEFGAFIVGLKLLDGQETLYPSSADFNELSAMGFQVSRRFIEESIGLKVLQKELGYFPARVAIEDAEAVKARMSWLGEQIQHVDHNFTYQWTDKFLGWASRQLLLPSRRQLRTHFQNDTQEIRKALGFEPSRLDVGTLSRQEVIRFAFELMSEAGRPLSIQEMRDARHPVSRVSLEGLAMAHFDSPGHLWEQFGFFTNHQNRAEKDKVLNRFIRAGIPETATTQELYRLSKKRKASVGLAKRHPGGVPQLRKDLRSERHSMRDAAKKQGVQLAPEVRKAMTRNYTGLNDYADSLKGFKRVLIAVSSENKDSAYIRRIMAKGLDLRENHKDIFDMQLEDVKKALARLGVTSVDDRLFVGRLIPAFDEYQLLTDEEIAELR